LAFLFVATIGFHPAGLMLIPRIIQTTARRCYRHRCFSRKYYASVMRQKEIYESNVGEAFAGIMSDFARRVNSSSQNASN